MKIYVVAFNSHELSPDVEYASTSRDACLKYLTNKTTMDSAAEFIREVTLRDDDGKPVAGIRVDD